MFSIGCPIIAVSNCALYDTNLFGSMLGFTSWHKNRIHHMIQHMRSWIIKIQNGIVRNIDSDVKTKDHNNDIICGIMCTDCIACKQWNFRLWCSGFIHASIFCHLSCVAHCFTQLVIHLIQVYCIWWKKLMVGPQFKNKWT